jgi:hypothetical protein
MTTVEIVFRYRTPPSEPVTFALASARDVYGIRRLKFDSAARTLSVEYDATRLNAATVAGLMRQAGLDILSDTLPEVLADVPPDTFAAQTSTQP